MDNKYLPEKYLSGFRTLKKLCIISMYKNGLVIWKPLGIDAA